jgi:hypothetical protein
MARMTWVELRCRCGSLSGRVDFAKPSRVRVVCHCGDCRRYARQLGSDAATEIVQVAPDQVTFEAGAEQLRCLRLTDRGLTRWFSACCKTPLANTSRYAWMPFVGLMRVVVNGADEGLLGEARHVNGPHPTPWLTLLRSLRFLLAGFILRRQRPNPFFDAQGAPIALPASMGDHES